MSEKDEKGENCFPQSVAIEEELDEYLDEP